MNENIEIDSSKIHLQEINILSGHFSHDGNLDTNQVAGFSFSYSSQASGDEEAKVMKITLSIEIMGHDSTKQELPLKVGYTSEFIFLVENLEVFLLKNEKGIEIHSVLGTTLNSISYSTMRGIVLTRTQGSLLKNGILLPIINPSALL